jgi:hypothetical protein
MFFVTLVLIGTESSAYHKILIGSKMKLFRSCVPHLKRRGFSTEYDPNLPKKTLSILKSLDRSIKDFTEKLESPDSSEQERNESKQDIFRAETLKKMFLDPKLQNLPKYVPPTPQEQFEKMKNRGIEEDDFIPPGGAVGITENHRNKIFFQKISHLKDSDGWKSNYTLIHL